MTKRVTNLLVTTNGAEEWLRLFQDMSELASNLAVPHEYVNLATYVLPEDDGPQGDPEGLHYDEYTMLKVRTALLKALNDTDPTTTVLGSYQDMDNLVMDLITELQNAGILFRERPKKS